MSGERPSVHPSPPSARSASARHATGALGGRARDAGGDVSGFLDTIHAAMTPIAGDGAGGDLGGLAEQGMGAPRRRRWRQIRLDEDNALSAVNGGGKASAR